MIRYLISRSFKAFLLFLLYLFFLSGFFLLPVRGQTGPGGVGNAGGTGGQPANVLWLDAGSIGLDNDDPVGLWNDISGNDNNAVQNDVNRRPLFKTGQLNGMPAIVFDPGGGEGNQDFMAFDGNVIAGTDYTVIFAGKRRSDNALRMFMSGTGTGTNNNLHIYWANSAQFRSHHWGNDLQTNMVNVSESYSAGTSPNEFGIFSTMLASGEVSAQRRNYQNNHFLGSINNSDRLNSWDGAAIGRWRDDVYHDVDAAEIIIFSNALNNAQLQIVHQYLAVKYGIVIDNSLYSPDPSYVYDVAGIGGEADGLHTYASSAGLYLNALSGLTAGDYLLVSHNNAPNGSGDFSGSGLPAGVERRFNRIWSVEAVNTPEGTLAFSVSETVDGGQFPANHENYVLLRRDGTAGDFEVVKNANGISGGDRVFFNLNSSELLSGYYTLGTTDEVDSPLQGVPGRTWYTLVSGSWDSWETWTLDPSGALPNNPGQLTPSTSPTSEADRVVILSGRTVEVDSDNLNHSSVTVDGRLDLRQTSGHTFAEIRGNGRILLAADNFPSGDATHFVSAGRGEGTVVYYGGNYVLSAGREFFDVRVELDGASDVITLLNDYIVNGNLVVASGNLKINGDGPGNSDILNLTVHGDVTVESGAMITTGEGDTRAGYQIGATLPEPFHSVFHQFLIYGNFTNYGTVRLTNQNAPAYNAFTTSGGVTVRFAGAANRSVNLYGLTDFYNMIVDKGTGKTHMLTVYADRPEYFRLFGPNNVGINSPAAHGFSAENPQVRKALFIRNGTLKLTGNIEIPTLTEGGNGDYLIGKDARLWIAGDNVRVYSTASNLDQVTGFTASDEYQAAGVNTGSGSQALSVYGEFRITAGFFGTRNSAGLIFWSLANAQVKIEGGEVDIAQFRSAGSGDGVASYVQSGGLLRVRGNVTEAGEVAGGFPLFGIDNETGVFNMSGGEIILHGRTGASSAATNGFYIPSSPGNYNVTGGKVTVEIRDTRDFEIGSTAPVWDLIIKRLSGSGTATVRLTNDLKVLKNLIIEDNSLLDVWDGEGDENGGDAVEYDLYIGGDLDLAVTGQYNARRNTTFFTGNSPSVIYARNNSVPAPIVFSNVEIIKNQQPDPSVFQTVTLGDTGRTTDQSNINNTAVEIAGNLRIARGELDVSSFKISLRGNIEITDGWIIPGSTGQGRIVLNGSALQTLRGGVNRGMDFGNLELDNDDGALLLSDIRVDDILLSRGIFNLDKYNIDVGGSISTGGTFSQDLMFMTAGNASDGGLTIGVGSAGSYLFPLGTGANDNIRYTPLNASFSGVTSTGKVTLSVDDRVLPTLNPGSNALSYSWRVRHSGFTGLPTVGSYVFTCSPDDYPGTLPWGGNWRPGKVVGIQRSNEGGGNLSGTNITFNAGFPLEEGSYTAAEQNAFSGQLRVFYSRGPQGLKNWSDRATWSLNGHEGNQVGGGAGNLPGAGDIVIIGYIPNVENGYHWVVMDNNNTEVAEVWFAGDGSTWNPRLYIQPGHSQDLGKVSGRGGLIMRVQPSNIPVVTGDLGDFINNDDSDVMYHITANGHVDIPGNIDMFPHLRVEAQSAAMGSRTLSFEGDILVRRNFTVDGNSTVIIHNGDHGNIRVEGNAFIGGWNAGRIYFPETGTGKTFSVGGNLQVRNSSANNALGVLNSTPSGLQHSLQLGGNLIQDQGTINLFTNNAGGNNVFLELTGEDNGEYTRTAGTAPSLYRIVMNKLPERAFDFRSDFTLGGDAGGEVKPVQLLGGRLSLEHALIDIILTSGGPDFRIPAGTGLITGSGSTVRASGSNSGIWLDGSIVAGGGSSWLLDGGSNNYIEYSSSGNASIEITDATFRLGSQLRRSASTEEGILSFSQGDAGSVVVIGSGGSLPENSRGVFEILNSGSSFEMAEGARLIIANAQDNPAFPSFYLDADSYSAGAGSEIQFGNGDTRAGQNMGLFSMVELRNISVRKPGTADPALRVWYGDITADGSIVIEDGATLDAGGRDITLSGDWHNQGTYVPSGNTTFFNGSGEQSVSGATVFHNLVKNGPGSLVINSDIVVQNNLSLASGSFNDGDNTLSVRGNVLMDIIHTHGGTGKGILFDGNEQQVLAGSGVFGKLSVNNGSGVRLLPGNSLSVNDALQLENGVLDIDANLLLLNEDAVIIEAAPFGVNNMIQTNISFTDAGVVKRFPVIAPPDNYSFTFPIGSQGKYTPVVMNISAMEAGGAIRVKAADEMHPTISDNDVCEGISNTENVLDYHWTLDAVSVSGFTAEALMYYHEGDLLIDGDNYNTGDYVTARLLRGSEEWNKFGPEDFDASLRRLRFIFSDTGDTGISGDYTAGVEDPSCQGALPDRVRAFISVVDGNWEVQDTWAVYDMDTGIAGEAGVNVPGGGPRGTIVFVEHEVVAAANFINCYRTVIGEDGLLRLGTTFGHRLGIVQGRGTLQLERGNLPAGVYDDFFGVNGGTVEFSGSGNYDVLGGITAVNNLKFSGTGQRRLPNIDLRVLGSLTIEGDDSSLEVRNEHDRILTVEGDVLFTGGSFNAGTGPSGVILGGSSVQVVTGNFTGSNAFRNLEADNAAGIVLEGNIDIDGQLKFSSGIISAGAGSLVTIRNASETAVTGYDASRYVDGPVRKLVNSGGSFVFPVGDGTRYGRMEIINTSTSSAGYWEARYYNESPHGLYDISSMADPVKAVSNNEYWSVAGPENGESFVRVRWDALSQLPAATNPRTLLHIVRWDGSAWESVGNSVTDNGVNNGTITTANRVSPEEGIFTIGSADETPLPTAGFTSGNISVCEGATGVIVIGSSGNYDLEVDIFLNGIFLETLTIGTALYNYVVSEGGTYSINAVSDTDSNEGNPFGNDVVVTLLQTPSVFNITSLPEAAGGTVTLCDGDTGVEIGLDGSEPGITYQLLVDGSPAGATVAGTGSGLVFGFFTVPGIYSVVAADDNDSGGECQQTGFGSFQVTVHSRPAFTLEGSVEQLCQGLPFELTVNFSFIQGPYRIIIEENGSVAADETGVNDDPYVYTVDEMVWTGPDNGTDYSYNVTVIDVNGCSSAPAQPVEVVVWRLPVTGPQYHIPDNFEELP